MGSDFPLRYPEIYTPGGYAVNWYFPPSPYSRARGPGRVVPLRQCYCPAHSRSAVLVLRYRPLFCLLSGCGDTVLRYVLDQPVHLKDLPPLSLTDLDSQLAYTHVVGIYVTIAPHIRSETSRN